MRPEPVSCRIVIEGNPVEYKTEIRPLGKRLESHDIVGAARDALMRAGNRTPRKNPVAVKVTVYTQRLERGEIKETPHTVEVVPQLERMTEAEYREELDTILAEVPEQFRSFVSGKAYEDGHASGYEECISHAQDLVYGLKPCILAYYHAVLDRVAEPGNQEIVNRLASRK